ncbi:MAG: PSD1 and planctomycete cytochrome C domain-containing protein [Bryobacteraceae bacterium]
MWWVTFLPALIAVSAAASDGGDFFERRIRPVLAKNCFACHSRSKLGGLELTSREALLKGGKRGGAILPGNPVESLLIRAVKKTGDVRMPPQGRLSDQEIDDLALWVKAGAPWPDDPALKTVTKAGEYVITPEQRAFWSFQPLRQPALPAVGNAAWVRTGVDAFVLARLEAKGLTPVEPADRRTWIRRVTFDLTGLPPTPEEVQAFVEGGSPAAVVDRLLSSSAYGERWGRYWLDVVRYSNDVMYGKAPAFDRYRDWVIRALNDDMPYDVFVKAHLAADLLPDSGKLLPALTPFVDTSSEFADDDRVDVLGRGFLGLTLQCAQCHDHKYDPIPTQDFYSLMGVFRSTRSREQPLAPQEVVDEYARRRGAVDHEENALRDLFDRETSRVIDSLAAGAARYLMAAAGFRSSGELDAETLDRWRRYLAMPVKSHPFLKPWDSLIAAKAGEAALRAEAARFETRVREVIGEKKAVDEYNHQLTAGVEVQRTLGEVEGRTMARDRYMLWQDLCAKGNPTLPLSSPEVRADGVLYYRQDKLSRFLPAGVLEQAAAIRARVAESKKQLPSQYPYLSVIEDVPAPVNLRVHLRGNPQNLGEEAPRRFLRILSQGEPSRFRHGAGRLELAERISSPANPLTARVFVNRVWEWHFGRGLVRTLSNFGQTGERPSNPELLDYLARRFIDQGWSLKKLHREILLSSTYALSARSAPANAAADPDNRLHWRFQRRRLDAEALRDAMLAAGGNLDRTPPPGEPEKLESPANLRRTVYGFVSRQRLDPMLAVFDFPNPNLTSEQRVSTTVPTQRLFLLNSDLVVRQSQALAARVCRESSDEHARIARMYQLAFQRGPKPGELRAAARFVADGPSPWPRLAQVLLASNEFLYIE